MKSIKVQFTGITFDDPNFPLDGADINGEFTLKPEGYQPPDRHMWSTYLSPVGPSGVYRFIRVIQGLAPDVYYQVVMELSRPSQPPPVPFVDVFVAQQPALPVTNTQQYGGTATVV
jgi:hypothetical protein